MDSILPRPPTIPRIHMDAHQRVFKVPERGSCPRPLSTERVRRPRGGGGGLHNILPWMCGLKLEGNGSFLDLEGGKQSTGTSIWVYFRRFTPVWVCFQGLKCP